MADVFGAAVAAVQLANYCFYILGVTKKLKRSTAVLVRYQQLLQDLSNLSQAICKNPLLQTQEIATQTLLIICTIRETDIPRLLEKGRLSRTLTFLLRNQELADIFAVLENEKATLSLSIQNLQSKVLHEIRDNVRIMANHYRVDSPSPTDSAIGDCSTIHEDEDYGEKRYGSSRSSSFAHHHPPPFASGLPPMNPSSKRANPFDFQRGPNGRVELGTPPPPLTFKSRPLPAPAPKRFAPAAPAAAAAAVATDRIDALERALAKEQRVLGGGGAAAGRAVFRNNVSRGAGDMVLGVVIEGASARQLARLARAPLETRATWIANTKSGPGPQILGVDVVARGEGGGFNDDDGYGEDDFAGVQVPAVCGTWEENVAENLVVDDKGSDMDTARLRPEYSQIVGARVRFT